MNAIPVTVLLCVVALFACGKKSHSSDKEPSHSESATDDAKTAADPAPTPSPQPATKRVNLNEYYVNATIEVPSGTDIESDMLGTDRDFAWLYVAGRTEDPNMVSAHDFEIEVHPEAHCQELDAWLKHVRNPKAHGSLKLVNEIQNELTDKGLLSFNEFVDAKGKPHFKVGRCHAELECTAWTDTRAHAEAARDICATLEPTERPLRLRCDS